MTEAIDIAREARIDAYEKAHASEFEEQEKAGRAAYKIFAENYIRNTVPKVHRGGWSNYETRLQMHEVLKTAAQSWIKEFELGKTIGLRLGGVVGCGKTRLGYAIIEGLIRRGVHRVFAINAIDLFSRIRQCWDSQEHNEFILFNELLDNDVLFIDDLGSESGRGKDSADYVLERLFLLLDRAQRDGRPILIISSNMGLGKLKQFYGPGNGDRITSRLEEMTEVLGQFPAIDMRSSQKQRNRGETNAEKSTLAPLDASLASISRKKGVE